MKYIGKIIGVVFLLSIKIMVAQDTTKRHDKIIIPPDLCPGGYDPNAPLNIVEKMPTFPEGEGALMKFEQANKQNFTSECSGTCYITFVIERDGSITKPMILRGVTGCPDLDAEAIRIIKSMPNWCPGMDKGKPARVQFNLPIKFLPRNTH